MKIEKIIKPVLIWLPSIVISLFYLSNAIEKIFYSNQLDKVVTNSTVMIMVGIILLAVTVLFLINKTIIWGTTILVLYMILTVFIHMYRGKPFEVTILIAMCTIFAAYLRMPNLFHRKKA